MIDRLRWGGVFLGLSVLAVSGMSLVGLAVLGAVREAGSPVVGGVLLLFALFGLRGIIFEVENVRLTPAIETIERAELIAIAAAILLGGFATFVLVVEGQLTPVVAASLTGLVAVVVKRSRAVPAYCGAFVGMTSPVVFPTFWQGLVAAVLAVAVYLLTQPAFHGVGGKLGTTAFVGATLTILGTSTSFLSGQLPAFETIGLIVGCSVVASVVTFSLHQRSPLDPVSASAIVGIVSGITLPLMYPEVGGMLAAAVYAASFAGMSGSNRIPNERWMAFAGLVVGLLMVYTAPYVAGSGGKLGTIAFISCLTVYGVLGTADRVLVRMPLERLPRRDVT